MRLRNATCLYPDMQFRAADLLIDEDGFIAEVVAPGSGQNAREAEEFDCADCLVLPGLVNAHFHSQASMVRGLNRKTPSEVQEALRTRVYKFLEEEVSGEEFKTACIKDYLDLVHQGVTFCADLGTGDRDPELYADAMSEVGLRGIVDAYDDYETAGGSEGPESDLQRFAAHLPEGDFSDDIFAAAQKLKIGSSRSSLCTGWRRRCRAKTTRASGRRRTSNCLRSTAWSVTGPCCFRRPA